MQNIKKGEKMSIIKIKPVYSESGEKDFTTYRNTHFCPPRSYK